MKISEELRLSQSLKGFYKKLEGQEVTVGEFIDSLGEKGFGILFLIFALPSMLPLASAGIATPLGLVIAFLGLQMMFGRPTPWLPKRARAIKMKAEFAKKMIEWMLKFSSKMERFIRPRMDFMTHRMGERMMGFLICVVALIMALPFPLTNTVPAIVIFLIGVGLAESDGLMCLIGTVLSVATIIAYGYAFFLFLFYGKAAFVGLLHWVKNLF